MNIFFRDRDDFLASDASLTEFRDKMSGFSSLKQDIIGIRNSAHLNLFILDCKVLNEGMIHHCQELYDSLIDFQVSTVL